MATAAAARRERWRRRYWNLYRAFTKRADRIRASFRPSFATSETARKAAEMRDMLDAADDPTTSTERLEQIADVALRWLSTPNMRLPFTHIAGRIIEQTGAHPNTPPELLLRLAKDGQFGAVEGLFRNPVLPLLPLEIPDFAARWEERTVREILRRNDAPESLLRLLSAHPDPWIALETRTHRNLAKDLPPNADPWAELEPLLRPMVATVTAHQARLAHVELVEEGIAPDWIYDREWLDPEGAVRDGEDGAEYSAIWPERLAGDPTLLLSVQERRFYRYQHACNPGTIPLEKCQEFMLGYAMADRWKQISASGKSRMLSFPLLAFFAYRYALNTSGFRRIAFKVRPVELNNKGFLVRMAFALPVPRPTRRHWMYRLHLRNDPNRYVRAAARMPANRRTTADTIARTS